MIRTLLIAACLAQAALGAVPRVCTFDARPLRTLDLTNADRARQAWDTWHVLAALQGIVNRDTPRLYVFFCHEFGIDTDGFWWEWYRSDDGWLRDSQVEPLPDLRAVVERFRNHVRGLVVYDPAVPATSNLASTAAGCDDLLPVRFDPSPGSVDMLLRGTLGLPVRLWLVNTNGAPRFTGAGRIPDLDQPSTGSAKADAYRWAVHHFLAGNRCRPGLAAYYLDAYWLQHPRRGGPELHTLPNHDYFVAHRSFFFDLACWADEPATDDPQQPAGLDRQILLEVLRALYDRAGGGWTRIGGFTPWPFKYTNHGDVGGRHGGVETEWEFSRIVSQFNGYVEADAAGLSALANASFHQHYPRATHHPQPNPPPGPAHWRNRGWVNAQGQVQPRFFVGHYVGDYDAPSWLYKAVPAFFRGPGRGRIPLGWAFNPNLEARAPQALVYARRQATTNDWFIAGNSGAGYVNPRALSVRPDSGLPSGLERWVEHCRDPYRRWDLTITGFMLDGAAGASTDAEFAAYARFSPNGIGTHFEKAPSLRQDVPTCPERDLPDAAAAAADTIARLARDHGPGPGFLWARSILKPPSWYASVADHLQREHPGHTVEFVDPYSFFGLIRTHYAR